MKVTIYPAPEIPTSPGYKPSTPFDTKKLGRPLKPILKKPQILTETDLISNKSACSARIPHERKIVKPSAFKRVLWTLQFYITQLIHWLFRK